MGVLYHKLSGIAVHCRTRCAGIMAISYGLCRSGTGQVAFTGRSDIGIEVNPHNVELVIGDE